MQSHIIGHIRLSNGELPFNHGVTALSDVQTLFLVHARTRVAQINGRLGMAGQHVEQPDGTGVGHQC